MMETYKEDLEALQIQLVKLQAKLISDGARVLIIFEGRDGAGKDGTIKRLVEHMSPRDTRIFAPSKPSDRETSQWYFERFAGQLPDNGEVVVFNRSWYNRAGVERVMGFCTDKELEGFFDTVNEFESLLVRSGTEIRKYYLDISRDEQKKRLNERKKDPLKAWKISPIDAKAMAKWDDYTRARDAMLRKTSHEVAPWRIVRADHKKRARLNVIADILDSFSYPKKDKKIASPDRDIVMAFTPALIKKRVLAR